MVRIFVLLCLFLIVGCKSINKEKALKTVPAEYNFFENLDSLSAAYPNAKPDSLKTIKLEWFSLPPSDTVFVGITGRDTLFRITSFSDFSDVIMIGSRELNLEGLKQLHRFRGTGIIQISHFPELYDHKNWYLIEGVVAGCAGRACEPFYIVVEK